MKDEALRLALEALEKIHNHPKSFWNCMDEITAIKQALEQPEQKPVALGHKEKDKYEFVPTAKWFGELPDGVHHLYTSPPKREWQGLTDEEIRQICGENFIMLGAYAVDLIESIEAKLKQKNGYAEEKNT